MKGKKNDMTEFTPEALTTILRAYVENNNIRTVTGAVDFHRLAEMSGANHETIRKIYHGRHENPTWQTIEKIKELIGFDVNIAKE